jgi:hypothetical protein
LPAVAQAASMAAVAAADTCRSREGEQWVGGTVGGWGRRGEGEGHGCRGQAGRQAAAITLGRSTGGGKSAGWQADGQALLVQHCCNVTAAWKPEQSEQVEQLQHPHLIANVSHAL